MSERCWWPGDRVRLIPGTEWADQNQGEGTVNDYYQGYDASDQLHGHQHWHGVTWDDGRSQGHAYPHDHLERVERPDMNRKEG